MSTSLGTSSINYYEVLHIAQDADLNEINSAYKRLALKCHPDKTGGDTVSMDDFRRIQQAVETLRDPLRRIRHDDDLRDLKRRQGFPNVYQQSSSRIPHSSSRPEATATTTSDCVAPFGDPSYKAWVPRAPRYYFGGDRDRYMFSYSNSVHMNPRAADSVDELRHCDMERKETEELRQGLFDEERKREERRKEPMRARFMRDYEEEGIYDVNFGASVNPTGEGYDAGEVKGKEEAKKRVSEARMHPKSEDQLDLPCEEDGTGDYDDDDDGTCDSNTSNNISPAEYETAREDLSTDDVPFYFSCSDNKSTDTLDEEPPAYADHSKISLSDAPDLTKEQFAKWDLTAQFNASHINMDSAISPFIPYFNAKLSHPSGRYTTADLHSELQGLLLETFCGWLETQRLAIPGAKPLETGLSPQECSHLGYWTKDFESYECEACHRWMPMYTLICPGCGIKACISCKFHYVQQ